MTPQTTNKLATFKNFKGLWKRGGIDSCPPDHFNECQNCIFPGEDVASREALVIFMSTDAEISMFFVYSSAVQPVSPTSPTGDPDKFPMIYLDSLGNLWDAGVRPNKELHSFGTACNNFAALEVDGRIFISPKINALAMPGEYTYYWDGITFSKFGGSGPGGNLTLAEVNSGVVSAGLHYVGISYQFKHGYLSPPTSFGNITSDGTHDIEVTGIPISPDPNCTGRVVIMTLANQTEYFFVPGGTLDNTTDYSTTPFVINVVDTALISSADYLNDVLTSVASCASFRFYKARLALIGPSDYPFLVKISDVSIFESFNNIGGIITLPRDNDNNAPNASIVIDNVFYIFKPYGTWSTQDNGGNPASWDLTSKDAALGSYDTGISVFSSGLSGQDILDMCMVVHPRGLLLFNGNFVDTPLSFKIDDYWRNTVLTPEVFSQVKVANDIINKRFYILAYATGVLLLMDYKDGLTPQSVKWSVWTFGSTIGALYHLGVEMDQQGHYRTLFSMNAPGGAPLFIYTLNSTQLGYDSTADTANTTITQLVTLPLVFSEEGAMTTFTGLKFRITGSKSIGEFAATLFDEDGTNSTLTPGFVLNNYGAQDLFRGINYTTEKMLVQINTFDAGGDNTKAAAFTLKRVDVYGNKMWAVRPVLTQTK